MGGRGGGVGGGSSPLNFTITVARVSEKASSSSAAVMSSSVISPSCPVLERCSHSGEITLPLLGRRELSHLQQRLDFPLRSFCISSVRRLLHRVCGPSRQCPMENVSSSKRF